MALLEIYLESLTVFQILNPPLNILLVFDNMIADTISNKSNSNREIN